MNLIPYQNPFEDESAFVIRAGAAMLNAIERGAYNVARAIAWTIVGDGRLMRIRDGNSNLTPSARHYVEQAARVKAMNDNQITKWLERTG